MTQRTNFTQIPNEAITDPRLDPYDFKVLVRIFSYDKLYRSLRELSKELNISRPKLTKCLSNLEDYGWITKENDKWQKNWDNLVTPTALATPRSTALAGRPTLLATTPTALATVANVVSDMANSISENVNDVGTYNKIKEKIKENTPVITSLDSNPFPLSYFEQNADAINRPKIKRQAYWYFKKDWFITNGMSEPPTDKYGEQKFDNLVSKMKMLGQYNEWVTKLEKHLVELDLKKQESSFRLVKSQAKF
jgi:DNA-binding Lrp family transcriptional regulator